MIKRLESLEDIKHLRLNKDKIIIQEVGPVLYTGPHKDTNRPTFISIRKSSMGNTFLQYEIIVENSRVSNGALAPVDIEDLDSPFWIMRHLPYEDKKVLQEVLAN